MHGLQSIHSINEEAARLEFHKSARALLAQGLAVLYKTDSLGLADINEKPIGFDTVLARQALIGKGGKWSLYKAVV